MRTAIASAFFALGIVATPLAIAQDDTKEIALKDGTTLQIYKDGKMSMRDARGRVHSMKEGVQMETSDGKVIVMRGNEIWRKTTAEQLRAELYRGK